MKIKGSSLLGKSLSKKKKDQSNEKSSEKKSQQSIVTSKPVVHQVSRKSQQNIKHYHPSKNHVKGGSSSSIKFHEQTQELLERNFKQLKSLQKSENPLIVAEPTFVFSSTLVSSHAAASSRVFEELDNLIVKDSVLKAQIAQQQQQQHSSETATSKIDKEPKINTNKFAILAEEMDDEDDEQQIVQKNQSSWQVAPATFQLPERSILNSSAAFSSSSSSYKEATSSEFTLPPLPKMAIPAIIEEVDPDL